MCKEQQKCPFCENNISLTPCKDCGDYPIVNKNREVVCCNIECENYNKPYPVKEWPGIK